MKQFSTSAVSTDYFASGFNSVGDNVFSASNGIHIIVPQISGTRNTFDALVVNLENRANVRESHSSSSGVGLSTNLAESAGLMASMNLGTSGSRDTYLNEAYIRGAVDFTRAEVTNQGCCVMDITNSGASYRYVPMEEVHKSRNFAIGLSGLDLSSADAFAYSLGRGLASAATSAGVGMLASEAGLGGFVSTIAASLAGAYVNSEVMPQMRDADHRPTGLGSTGTLEMEHDGHGFRSTQIDFDRTEFNHVIDLVKAKVFDEALDKGLPTQEAVQMAEQEKQKFIQDLNTEKAKVEETSDFVEQIGKEAVEEINAEIGESEVAKLAGGLSVSQETRTKIGAVVRKFKKNLVRERDKMNLLAPLKSDIVEQTSLQTRNELFDDAIRQCDAILTEVGELTSNSRGEIEDFSSNLMLALNHPSLAKQAVSELTYDARKDIGALFDHPRMISGAIQELAQDKWQELKNDRDLNAFFGYHDMIPGAIVELCDDGVRKLKSITLEDVKDAVKRGYNSWKQRPLENTAKTVANISSVFVGGSLFKASKEASVARFGENTAVALKAPTRIDVIHEPEMIRMALAAPTEWKGQFKLVREFTQTSGNAEFSKLYSKEVLFKDPKSGQMFRVLQRNDIDPNQIITMKGVSETNLQKMLKGHAPYTTGGEQVKIHHMGQDACGPFVEVTDTTHKSFLHNQFGYGKKHPTNPVIRSEFNPIRAAYWRAYAEQFK